MRVLMSALRLVETVYKFLNAPECVNNVYICFYLFQSTITVSRKPYLAGYQILLCFLMFVYMLYLICDTLINYYLLTYLPISFRNIFKVNI